MSMIPIFNIICEYCPMIMMMHVWCKFGASIPAPNYDDLSCATADKVKFTDGQTDGRNDRRTGTGNDNTLSA